MTQKAGKLQINEDLAFQRREWRAQHIGWFALCVFVAAALAGVFGGGPLSRAVAGDPGTPLWVEYERFVRRGTADRMTIHVAAGPAATALEVRLSRQYFDGMRLEHVYPEPDATEIGASDVVFTFTGGASAQSSAIVLDFEPLSAGPQTLTVTASGAAPLTFTQFAYF